MITVKIDNESYRDIDMRTERVVADYMDRHLYSSPLFTRHDRTDTIEEQLSGSDIILSVPSLGIQDAVTDEKALTHYMTRQLPTFALELSFLRRDGTETTGWLTDTTKKTELYMLLWPSADKDLSLSIEDIRYIDYVLVRKTDILGWLESHGYGIEELIDKSSEIRKSGITGAIDKEHGYDFWFYMSDRLAEKPINVVIRRKVYEELALMKGRV